MRKNLATEVAEVQSAEEICQQKLRLFTLIGGVHDKEVLDTVEETLMHTKVGKSDSHDKAAEARRIPVGDVGFSHQLAGIIRGKGFNTLGDLADKTHEELSDAGFKKGLPQIEAKLQEYGLR